MRPENLGTTTCAAVFATLLALIGPIAAQEATEETTGALPQETSTPPMEEGGAAVDQPAAGSGIFVTKRPVEVLAGPSSSASVLYGFPAGRPFRLIGRDAGFAQIQDLKSSATGWIDETALAQPSPREAASAPVLRRPRLSRTRENCPQSRALFKSLGGPMVVRALFPVS